MKAFSLIELMVVVIVIAVLSAAAIPSYLTYMQRGKLGTARTYLDDYDTTLTNFYSDHGRFPANSDLGIPTSVPTSAAQYLYPPYVAYVTFQPQSNSSSQCPYTINTGYFSNYAGDYYSNGTSNYVVFYNFFIDNNGTMDKLCAFYEFSPAANAPTTNNLFPDCLLTNNPTASNTSIMTLINTACT